MTDATDVTWQQVQDAKEDRDSRARVVADFVLSGEADLAAYAAKRYAECEATYATLAALYFASTR